MIASRESGENGTKDGVLRKGEGEEEGEATKRGDDEGPWREAEVRLMATILPVIGSKTMPC